MEDVHSIQQVLIQQYNYTQKIKLSKIINNNKVINTWSYPRDMNS